MQVGVDSERSVENRRIYVIEEDEITRAALQFMLHDENETHEFDSIAKAQAKSADWPPDLVLLGYGLLVADDSAFLTQLKISLGGKTKVLLVCDAAQEKTVRANDVKDISAYIIKPLTIEKVRARVDSAFGRKRSLNIPVARV